MTRIVLCLGVVAVATGCATTTTQTTYVVRQAGLVPGLSGPLITGPGLPSGSWSLSAGAQTGSVNTGASRDQGGLGTVIADSAGRLALGYSWSHFDLAAAIEVRANGWAKTTASDVSASQFGTDVMVYPTLAGRWRMHATRNMEVGFITELSLPYVPYCRQTLVSSTTTTTYPNGSSQGYDWSQATSQSGGLLLPLFRVGPTLSWRFGRVLGLSVGTLLVNEPFVQGITTVTQTCTNGSCSGQTASNVPTIQYAAAIVPFVSPTLTFGHLRIIGQLFANLSTNAQLSAAAPLGAEILAQARF